MVLLARMKLVIAATGASGTVYLQRLLEQIDASANEVHLVMSGHAKQVAATEVDRLEIPPGVLKHGENDLNVPFVSGSARFDAMVIVPCSMATLGRLAAGTSESALLRAADVFLKERRKLILVPRETPWSLIHARNVVTLLEAGAIVLPAIPSFYSRPQIGQRRGRHRGLAHPGSDRAAESARLSLERREQRNSQALKIEGWRARWLIAFGHRLLQIWARTLRFQIEDRANVVGTPPNERYIGALWHNRLLLLPFVLKRYLPERRGAALISGSRDGALLADLVERFGFEVVRGSSSKKGASAMRQLAEVIAGGKDAVITPDGPRGPAYELGPGHRFSRPAIRRGSGADQFGILQLLAVEKLGPLHSAQAILERPRDLWRAASGAQTSTDEEFERERQRLQDAMMQLVEMR